MGELKLKKLIKPEELAEALGVDISWVWNETRAERIPKVKNLGRLIRFTPETVKKLFNIEISDH